MEGIKHKALKGVRWTAVSAGVTALGQVLQMIILARLLSPADFGRAAIVAAVIALSNPLADAGMTAAVIREKQLSAVQQSSLYWFNILAGFMVFGIILLLAPQVAGFYQYPPLTPLILAGGSVLLLAPWGSQYGALLARELDFRPIARIEITAVLLSLLVSVVLALEHFGAYALVIGQVVKILSTATGYIWAGRRYFRPQWSFDMRSVKSQLRFGAFETGNQLVNYFSANVDKLIIGKLLGAEALGLYSIAWNIMLLPLARINPVLTRVTFPLFSKIKENPVALASWYTKAVTLLMIVNVPLLAGATVVSRELLTLVYGSQWSGAATALAILCPVGIIKAFGNPGGSIILARGRSDLALYWNIIWTLVIAGAMYLFLWARPTVESAAMAQLAAALLVGWVWHFLISQVGPVPYGPVLRQTAGLVALAGGMALLIFLAEPYITGSLWTIFLVKIMLGVIIYLPLLFWLYRKHLPFVFFNKK